MNNVKYFRGKLGMTQQELGDKIGVERAFVHLIESALSPIPKTKALQLCEIFSCNLPELYGDEFYKFSCESDNDKKNVIRYLSTKIENPIEFFEELLNENKKNITGNE